MSLAASSADSTTRSAVSLAAASLSSSGDLADLVRETKQCVLTPSTFFVAWHGVLALVFSGFPSSLHRLKSLLNTREADFGLQKEQMGSKWPKITLGCLKEERMLSQEEAQGLLKICHHFRAQFASAEQQQQQQQWRMAITHLSYARFASRTLQKIVLRTDIPLAKSESSVMSSTTTTPQRSTTSSFDESVSSEESARVAQIVDEFNEETLPAYLNHINKPGGRYKHYHSLFNDASLVAFCSTATSQPIQEEPPFLQEFRDAVDQLLPGAYHWFPWSALHVTIRAM